MQTLPETPPAPSATTDDPMVLATALTRRYGTGSTAVDALAGVTLEMARGEFIAVMGPSGSGKSTLMHILAGLDVPTSGRVMLGGRDVGAMSDTELTRFRRAHVGFVFQSFNLLPMLSAEQNVLLPLRIARARRDRAWTEELIHAVGLEGRRRHRPAEMSGGQQQRVAIARALVARPSVLFADEPTGNLDSRTGHDILTLLRATADRYGQTTMMVTHDARAAAVADRVLFLADGRIAASLGAASAPEILRTLEEVTR